MIGLLVRAPLSKKFGLLVFMVVLGLLGSSGLGIYATISLSNELIETNALVKNRVAIWHELNENMLMARRAEKDFLLRALTSEAFFSEGKSKYLDKHKNLVEAMKLNCTQLKSAYKASDELDAQEISGLIAAVDSYNEAFLKLVAEHRARGFKNHGRIGEMRESIHSLEEKTKDIKAYYSTLLLCRRHEKDYLLRQDAKYFAKFKREVQTLRNQLRENKEELLALDSYRAGFNKVIAIDSEIGRDEQSGTRGLHYQAVEELETNIDLEKKRLLKQGSKASENQVRALAELRENFLQSIRLEEACLRKCRTDDEFYAGEKVSYLERHRKSLERFLASTKSYAESYPSNSSKTLQSASRNYQQSFSKLIAQLRRRGFRDFGLIGDLREAIHELESRAQSNSYLFASMLLCRRHEKDYLLRGDLKYNKKLQAQIATMAETLKGVAEAGALLDNYQATMAKIVKADETLGLTQSKGLRGRMRSAIHKLEDPIDLGVKKSITNQEKRIAESQSKRETIIQLTVALCLTLLLFIIALTVWMSRSILKMIRDLRERTEQVTTGNLNVQFRINDESKDELHLLEKDLSKLIQELRSYSNHSNKISGELSTVAVQINGAIQEQTSTLSSQAAAISQANGSLEEMKVNAFENDSRAQDILISTKETLKSMSVVERQVEGIATSIIALSERTQQIVEILDSVSDIADQSNLLALNASIEASKAGEFGQGFEVVAVEVRNLAVQSKKATASIRGILRNIQEAVSKTVMQAEEGTKKVSTQSQDLEKTARSIEQIVYATREQTKGIEQIAGAVGALNSGITETQTSSSQIAMATAGLVDQSSLLRDAIAKYST